MSQSNDDTIVVLLAGYGSVAAAAEAFDAVRGVFVADGAAVCDAAVIDPRETAARSRVLRDTRRHAADAHAHDGLVARLARYLGEGLALTGGPAGGGVEVVSGPLDSDDVRELAAVQESAPVVLIALFPAVMSDPIAVATHAADSRASKELRASAEQLEAQIVRAEQRSITDEQG
jgi:hypothetical protein